MRESRFALLAVAIGVAPLILKKSKPLARYVGDQLIRAGEYMKLDTEEETPIAPPPVAEPVAVAEEPVAVVEEVVIVEEVSVPVEETPEGTEGDGIAAEEREPETATDPVFGDETPSGEEFHADE